MNDTFDLRSGETHIEVHKFRGGTILFATVFALFVQAFLPVYLPRVTIVDLPLLITIYFGLSRRNPSTGLLLGCAVGCLQDLLGKTPLGFYGIAKTLIGFAASSIGGKLDTEHPVARFALTFIFFALHQGIVALVQRLLLAHRGEAWFTMHLAVAALVNAAVAVFVYFLLDRLRRT
jgi:rod shape-determining protein MreD